MNITSNKCFTKDGLAMDGPLIIEPKVFKDVGILFESWNKKI